MMFAEAVRRTHNNESVSYLFSNVPYVWPELPAAVAIKLFPSYDWNLRYFKKPVPKNLKPNLPWNPLMLIKNEINISFTPLFKFFIVPVSGAAMLESPAHDIGQGQYLDGRLRVLLLTGINVA